MNEDVLTRPYSFNVVAEPEGGYAVYFPDLPGCMTQVESLEEVSAAALEIKTIWIESVLSQGMPIPEPTYAPEHSGRFVIRMPRTLHRSLAHSAETEGVSLNQYVVTLLAQQNSIEQVRQFLEEHEWSLSQERPTQKHSYSRPASLPEYRGKRTSGRIPQAV